MPLQEQELLTLHKNLTSPPVFSGIHVIQSLVFCVVFCRSLFVFFTFFSSGNCIVEPSSSYGFLIPCDIFKRNFDNRPDLCKEHFENNMLLDEKKLPIINTYAAQNYKPLRNINFYMTDL